MPLHRIILRLMLWSLGISAVVGVGAVLTGGDDIIARVLGTAIATAFAALLMYPQSRLIDKAEWRQFGTFGMALVLVEYLIVLAMIWEVGDMLPGRRDEEQLFLTMLNFAATGIVAMVMLRMIHTKSGRVAGFTGLAISAAVAIIWLVSTWFSFHQDDLAGTGFILGAFGIVVIMSLIGVGVDGRHWRWLGVACGAVAAVLGTIGVWMNINDPSELFVLVATLGVVVAHANVMLRVPLKSGQRWLAFATIGAAVATGFLFDLAVIAHVRDDMMARVAGAGGILTACGTLAMLVLARLNRGIDVVAGVSDLTEITVICPRCRTKQDLPIGDAACKSCGLRIATRVEEPTCPGCGYLLLHLTGDTCPECGRPIAQ